jgi:hypothetical protein
MMIPSSKTQQGSSLVRIKNLRQEAVRIPRRRFILATYEGPGTKKWGGPDQLAGNMKERPDKTVQVKNGILLFWREQKRMKNRWNLF